MHIAKIVARSRRNDPHGRATPKQRPAAARQDAGAPTSHVLSLRAVLAPAAYSRKWHDHRRTVKARLRPIAALKGGRACRRVVARA